MYSKATGVYWRNELGFYYGSIEEPDFENDWRFKEIKGIREQAKFLGECELSNDDFPIQFPLALENAYLQAEDYAHDYKDENDITIE